MSITLPFLFVSCVYFFQSPTLLIKKTGAGLVQINLRPLNIQEQVTLLVYPLAHCQARITPMGGKEQLKIGRRGMAQQVPCAHSELSQGRKLLLSGPGVQEMGNPASLSGTTPPKEKGHSRPFHSGVGQTRRSISTGKEYCRKTRPRQLLQVMFRSSPIFQKHISIQAICIGKYVLLEM